ncbi:MAG: hypothetical protein DSZ05_02640, partial [Sulfurospirillum sp.]
MKSVVYLIFLSFLATPLFADKRSMLIQKGAKISKIMCDKKRLQTIQNLTPDEAQKRIVSEKICTPLNPGQLRAVALFATSKTKQTTAQSIHVPNDAKCPICGMFVAKYPKWTAFM